MLLRVDCYTHKEILLTGTNVAACGFSVDAFATWLQTVKDAHSRYSFNKIEQDCHLSQSPRWQVDKEAYRESNIFNLCVIHPPEMCQPCF